MNRRDISRRFRLIRMIMVLAIVFFIGIVYKKAAEKQINPPNDDTLVEGTIENSKDVEMDDYLHLGEVPNIRVLLKTSDYSAIFHAEVCIKFPDGGYALMYDGVEWHKEIVTVGEVVHVGYGTTYEYDMSLGIQLAFVPATEDGEVVVENLGRARDIVSYGGRIEVVAGSGGLVVVNELPLEQYLHRVLPSEMPASYDADALMAQAVLARTYAYKYLISPAYEEYSAHLDDSVMYQVYGNIEEDQRSTKAVQDTQGILLFKGNTLSDVYFYATSSGVGTDDCVWGSESGNTSLQARRIGAGVLATKEKNAQVVDLEHTYLELLREESYFVNAIDHPLGGAYEEEEPWYRWKSEKTSLSMQDIEERLRDRYMQDPTHVLMETKDGMYESKEIESLGELTDLKILERGVGGVVQSMLLCGTIHTYKVVLEYNIRYILNGSGVSITKQDGTVTTTSSLLPSGFFYMDTYMTNGIVTSYQIFGGGYGHGVGMSQNGANRMALEGMSCSDILKFYFPGSIFVSYEQ